MKIEDAIKGRIKRHGWPTPQPPAPLTLDDLRATDWEAVMATPAPAPAPTPTPLPTPAPAPVAGRVAFVGINISGGENHDAVPPRGMFFDYLYPTNAQVDYLASKGANIMRVPFQQPRVLQATDIAVVDKLIDYAGTKGVMVLLDLHQYGSTEGKLVGVDAGGTEALTKFWTTMAARYAGRSNVMLGMMNEPNKQTPQQWFEAARVVLAGIRTVAPKLPVLIPGSKWSGAASWVSSGNAAASTVIPADPLVSFDVHQYLDEWSTGQTATVLPGLGARCLVQVTAWARASKRTLALTEIGWAADPAAMKEAADALATIKGATDVWKVVTGWTGGAWYADTYFTKMTPLADKLDRPQFTQLMGLRAA